MDLRVGNACKIVSSETSLHVFGRHLSPSVTCSWGKSGGLACQYLKGAKAPRSVVQWAKSQSRCGNVPYHYCVVLGLVGIPVHFFESVRLQTGILAEGITYHTLISVTGIDTRIGSVPLNRSAQDGERVCDMPGSVKCESSGCAQN